MCFKFGKKELPLSTPKYVAHRGFSGYHPDNTAESFSAAAGDENFYGIETDIRRTKDGCLVCSHDDKAVFSDGSKRKVEDSTYAELMEKTLQNTRTENEVHICLFREYLTICKQGNKVAVVELKDVFTQDMIDQMFAEIDEFYDRKMCTVIAFDYDSLYRVRKTDPEMELQYLSSKRGDRHFIDCLNEKISVDVHYSQVNKSFVNKFHDRGLEVNVWTVNDEATQTRMRQCGVDYITSNVLTQDN